MAQSQAALDDLGTKLDAINEQFNDANAKLQASKAKQAELLKQLAPVQKKADEFQAKVAAIGAESYRSGRPSVLGALVGGHSAQDVVDRMGMLDQVSRDQAGAIKDLEEARKPLEATKKKIDAEVETQAKAQKVLADRKKALDGDYAKWKALNQKLEATSAKSRASRPGTPARDGGSTGGGAPGGGGPIVYNGPATGSAKSVVSFAYAQLGKIYVFGATGPDHFDCSGLTLAAWGRAGVRMPHSAHEQYNMFQKVSRSSLRPGDLVFFYGTRHHVGIYVGDGKMIHASTTGKPIALVSIDSSYYVKNFNGAVRPG